MVLACNETAFKLEFLFKFCSQNMTKKYASHPSELWITSLGRLGNLPA